MLPPTDSSSPLHKFIPVELASPEGWKSGLTIYAKALAVFAIAVLVLFAALFGLTESLILSQFESIEKEQLLSDLSRIEKLIELEKTALSSTTGDWAFWNDVHEFLRKPTPEFLEVNVTPPVLQNLRLDFITFWELNDRCVALATQNQTVQFPENSPLCLDLKQSGFLAQCQAPDIQTGFLLSQGETYLIAGASVLDSRRRGPSSGKIVLGKRLRPSDLSLHETFEGFQIRIQPFQTLLQSPELRTVATYVLANGRKELIYPDSENSIALLPLRSGNAPPVAAVVIQKKRVLFLAGQRVARIFLLTMTAAGGGLVLILWFVIDWSLLRRITRIDRGVRALAATGKFPEEAELRSHDELGRLSRSIVSLSESLLNAEQNYRRVFESSHDGTVVLSLPELKIHEANPAFCRFVETPLIELIGRRIDAVIPLFPVNQLLSLAETREVFQCGEIRLRPASPNPFHVEIVGSRFDTPDGTRIQLSLRDVTERREAEKKLRELSGRLLSLQDEERRKIARELHDSTAQYLSALEINLVLLEKQIPAGNGRALRLVEESRKIAGNASREIRTLSYLLHPPLLDEVGLLFAIRWFAEGYTARTNITIDLNLPESLPRFPAEIETTLFRVIQEALTNIYRHSGSQSGWIFLASEPREILLQIGDSGKGFNPASSPTGLGLAGMKERIRQLNGDFLVESSPRGTIISVRIPIQEAPHDARLQK